MTPYGLTIETALDGFAALEKVEQGGVYDVVFMDHMMPDMDGVETMKKMRELGYEGVVVALTANALKGSDEMFKRSGFDDFISKPINVKQLDTVLKKYVHIKNKESSGVNDGVNSGSSPLLASHYRLRKAFIRDAEKAVATLRESAASGDNKSFITTVHGMKSALASIGESDLSRVAAELEEAAINGSTDFVLANGENFALSLENILISISPEDSPEAAEGISEDTEFLAHQLNAIMAACDDYNDEAAFAALDLLKERQWKKETAGALEDIRDLLFLDSNFELASERIKELL